MDPLTLLIGGVGILVFKEMNRKDYGVLTPSRDERYRNAMESCHQPDMLLEEAKLFSEYGLKAQAAMLKRRAEWRARPAELKKTHEEIYQKALTSENIPAILEIAFAFEGWTATKKASNLREHVRELQEKEFEQAAREAQEAQEAAEAIEESAAVRETGETNVKPKKKKSNGAASTKPFDKVDTDTSEPIGEDT
jgi:hypothetical protein